MAAATHTPLLPGRSPGRALALQHAALGVGIATPAIDRSRHWDLSCGLRTDGTAECWGRSGTIPPPNGVKFTRP